MRYVMVLLILTGCSFQSKPQLENSYIPRLQELTLHGLDALHHGRLASSENSLQRALRSAWLSADMLWVGRAQYHLGALYLVQDKHVLARGMFVKARDNALQSHDLHTQWRSLFSLALLNQQTGEADVPPPALQDDMPVDVYLSAGRIFHLQGNLEAAIQAYQQVTQLSPEDPATIYVLSQAYLALALVAKDEQDTKRALSLSQQVLLLAKQAGLPMLAAHAKLLQGYLLDDVVQFEHAWQMYQALEDGRGQHDALQALLRHAVAIKDVGQQKRWKRALRVLGYQP